MRAEAYSDYKRHMICKKKKSLVQFELIAVSHPCLFCVVLVSTDGPSVYIIVVNPYHVHF